MWYKYEGGLRARHKMEETSAMTAVSTSALYFLQISTLLKSIVLGGGGSSTGSIQLSLSLGIALPQGGL
jgi:hypothetical protein